MISQEGLDKVTNFNFPNIKKKYNILPAMFGCKDNRVIIDFVNNHRNFFAIWTFAAIHIDHSQFSKFLYHAVVNYKGQKDAVEDITPLTMKHIEPMTYARFLYHAGKCMLKFNAKLYSLLKAKNLVQIQTEHCIEAFYGT